MNIDNRTGASIIDFPDTYVILDLETTGYDRKFDEIIEMAAIKVLNNEISDKFQSFVHPEMPIDEYIIKLTGITNEMVENAPYVNDAIPKILDFIGDLPIVGHFISFDVNFLCQNTTEIVSNNYIDTLRLCRKLFPDLEHHRLSDMVEFLNIPTRGYHRSTNDCENCFYLYQICKTEILKRYETYDNFKKLFKTKGKRSRSYKWIDIKNIVSETNDFDETHPLYKKECVFTGTLEKMKRADAMQLVVNLGGLVAKGVTQKTNYLILGNYDYCSTIKDGKSTKQKKAEQLKLKGQDIEIISERAFYDMLEIE